jgi:hypothetical protein
MKYSLKIDGVDQELISGADSVPVTIKTCQKHDVILTQK